MFELFATHIAENTGEIFRFERAIDLVTPGKGWFAYKKVIQHLYIMQASSKVRHHKSQTQNQLLAFRYIFDYFEVEQLIFIVPFLKFLALHLFHELCRRKYFKLGIGQQEEEIISLQVVVGIPHPTGERT